MNSISDLVHPICTVSVMGTPHKVRFYPSPRTIEDGDPDFPWSDIEDLLTAYGFPEQMKALLQGEILGLYQPDFAQTLTTTDGGRTVFDYSMARQMMADGVRYQWAPENRDRDQKLWSHAIKACLEGVPSRVEFEAFVAQCKKRDGFKNQ